MAKKPNRIRKATPKRRTSAPKAPIAPPRITASRTPAAVAPKVPSARPRIVTTEMIAKRAYELWQKNGGSETDNWLRAERELRSA